MVAGIPEPKTNEILKEIDSLIQGSTRDVFKASRISAELERAWKAAAFPAAHYYVMKALLELGKFQRESALAAARNAILLGRTDPMVQANASVVFSSVVAVEDGLKLVEDISIKHRDDKAMLNIAVMRSLDFLQFNRAVELAKHYEQVSSNDADFQSLLTPSIVRSHAAAKALHLTDEHLASVMKTAASAVIDAGCDIWRTSRVTLSDRSIAFSFHIEATPEICAEANFWIADALVQKFDDPAADFLSITCRPYSDISQLAGTTGAWA